MYENLKISLIQSEIFWSDVDKNIAHFSHLISKIENTQLIFLPEMFNTAFCPKLTHLAENMKGKTVNWMKGISKQKKCVIVGSLMIKENKKIFNRLVWISLNGQVITYDKWHLFSLVEENKYISKGESRIIIKEFGWTFCPLICYDLRFPVFSRNNDDYDVLIYLANWPERRIDAWDTLLKARAIENQCFTLGVNRIGQDGNGILFNGHSNVLDALGRALVPGNENQEKVLQISLNKNSLNVIREKINFLKDRDQFTLI